MTRFGLTSSCLCKNIPDVFKIFAEKQRRRREWETPLNLPLKGRPPTKQAQVLVPPLRGGRLGGVYSLRSLCASAMQLVGFCEQKLLYGLGNNAGSEERTYGHDLTRQILRQSLRVALCEKQLIYHDGYCKNQEVQSTGQQVYYFYLIRCDFFCDVNFIL